MKKFVTLITALFMMSSFFISSPAAATDSQVDQSCNIVDGNTTIWRPNGISQYFKPTLNRLTKVAVKVKTNPGEPANYTLAVKNSLGNAIYSQDFSLDSNGEVVSIPTNVFDAKVTVGSTYLIQLTGVNHLYWAYTNNTSCDQNGYAYYDGTAQSKDMDFYTYGYNAIQASVPPEPVITNPESPTGSSGSQTASSTAPAAKATMPVDTSIRKPELKAIEKDDKNVTVPVKDKVSITNKNKLKIIGTSTPGTSVVIFVGDTAYNTTIDKNGTWLVSLDGSKIKVGEYSVQAQAQKDGKGSEKADLFKLSVSKAKAVVQSTAAKKSFNMNKFYLGGLITILVLLCVLLYLEDTRLKNLKKKSKPKKIKSKSREIKKINR